MILRANELLRVALPGRGSPDEHDEGQIMSLQRTGHTPAALACELDAGRIETGRAVAVGRFRFDIRSATVIRSKPLDPVLAVACWAASVTYYGRCFKTGKLRTMRREVVEELLRGEDETQ